MFTNKLGTNLSPRTAYDNFKQVVASIGYPDVRFHELCHLNIKPKTKILILQNKIKTWMPKQIDFKNYLRDGGMSQQSL